MTDLLSVIITITARQDTLLPAHAGRAVYALFMRWLDAHSAELAKRWHDVGGIKPYTCSNIVGLSRHSPDKRLLKTGATAWFRMTALDSELAEVLLARFAYPPKSLDIDGQVLDVASITADSTQHPWAGKTTYQDLSAQYLLAQANPPKRMSLELVSPTTFKQNNLNQPLPMPDLVYGSLSERWNAFSSVGINPELREYCRAGVGINQFDIKSSTMPMKDEGMVSGCIGKVSYRVMSYDRYWQSMLALLTEYAFYAGIGRYTAVGMGQARQQVRLG